MEELTLQDLIEALNEGAALKSKESNRIVVLRIYNTTTGQLEPVDLTPEEAAGDWEVVVDSGIETALDDNFARVTT